MQMHENKCKHHGSDDNLDRITECQNRSTIGIIQTDFANTKLDDGFFSSNCRFTLSTPNLPFEFVRHKTTSALSICQLLRQLKRMITNMNDAFIDIKRQLTVSIFTIKLD